MSLLFYALGGGVAVMALALGARPIETALGGWRRARRRAWWRRRRAREAKAFERQRARRRASEIAAG